MSFCSKTAGAIFLGASMCCLPALAAPVMVGATSVSSSAPAYENNSIYAPINVINQSGLSTGYTSGVTDAAGYLASNPTHGADAGSFWNAELGSTAGTLTFDLGGLWDVQQLVLWNRVPRGFGIRGFSIELATDASFADAKVVGAFIAAQGSEFQTTTPAQVFSFAKTSAAYARVNVANSYSTCCMSLSEVAFVAEAQSVPEPGTLALVLAALGAVPLVRARAAHAARFAA